MSIQIGTTPIYQTTDTIIEVMSNRSNAMRLNSADDNIYINMGDFRIGQTSNASEYYFEIGDTLFNQSIIQFTKDEITLLKPLNVPVPIELENNLTINSNLFASAITTSNLTVINAQTQQPVATIDTNGNTYIAGSVGIGVPANSNYGLTVQSNVYLMGDLYGSNLYVQHISYSSNSTSQINITDNLISLYADAVQVTNLTIVGESSYDTIKVTGTADFAGTAIASNLILTNKATNINPLRIQQKLIDGQFGDIIDGNPISVISDFTNTPNQRIVQLSPYGHMVLGGIVTQNEYLITGRIQAFRDSYFGGFLSFTNSNVNRDNLTVNKSAHLSIGNPSATAMLEIQNNYQGNEQYYTKPAAMVNLKNVYSQNLLPLLRYQLPDNSTRLQITSNASLVFHNTPLNMYKYDIETSNTAFMNAIETNSIRGFTNSNIDVNFSSFNRVNDIRAESATLSNVYIYSLTVDDIFTDSLSCFETLNDPEELRILSTRMLVNSSNVVINRAGSFFASNMQLSGDTLRVYTSGNNTETINAIHAIGSNTETITRTTNTNNVINSRATSDYSANQNLFKIGVINKSTTPNNDGHMFITPFVNLNDSGITNTTAAINIFRDRSIRFGNVNFIHPSGYVTIGRDTIQLDQRLYVKGNALFLTASDDPTLSVATNNPYVGINTSIPLYNLHTHNSTVLMTTAGAPSFSISSGGNVGIGTSAGIYPFQVNMRSGFTNEVFFTSNVSIAGRLDTLGNVASTSDRSVKSELSVITNALHKVEQLNGYLYTRLDTGARETGLLAQEVKEVLPEAVHQANTGMYSLAYGNLAGLFVEAIKELKHRIEKIEAKLA